MNFKTFTMVACIRRIYTRKGVFLQIIWRRNSWDSMPRSLILSGCALPQTPAMIMSIGYVSSTQNIAQFSYKPSDDNSGKEGKLQSRVDQWDIWAPGCRYDPVLSNRMLAKDFDNKHIMSLQRSSLVHHQKIYFYE